MAGCRKIPSASTLCLILAVVLELATGCVPAEVEEAADKAEIQSFLEEYLPALGNAYAQADAYLIEPYVAPKEIARVGKRLDELGARGHVYEPTVRTITIESVNVWNNSNAFVSTLEVWDVRRLTSGTGLLIDEALEQPNRVKYQMKRDENGWRVLYRTIQE
jgi:hypothetical protein